MLAPLEVSYVDSLIYLLRYFSNPSSDFNGSSTIRFTLMRRFQRYYLYKIILRTGGDAGTFSFHEVVEEGRSPIRWKFSEPKPKEECNQTRVFGNIRDSI